MTKINTITTAAKILFFSLSLLNSLSVTADVQTALPTIYILPDGSIDPPTAPILRDGNTYTFTGDAFARLNIQKGNTVIDGAGYTLRGPYNGTKADIWIIGDGPNVPNNETVVPWVIGVDLGGTDVNGLTIKNLNVKNFS